MRLPSVVWNPLYGLRDIGLMSLLMLMAILWAETAEPDTGELSPHVIARCQGLSQRGSFIEAVDCWTKSVRGAAAAVQPQVHWDALRHLAHAYQGLGHSQKAIDSLEEALAVDPRGQLGDWKQFVALHAGLGSAYLTIDNLDKASEHLQPRALDEDQLQHEPGLLARVLLTWGNLRMAEDKPHSAIETYRRSAEQAWLSGDRTVAVRAIANAAKSALHVSQYASSEAMVTEAIPHLQAVESSRNTAYDLISLGLTSQTLCDHLPASRKKLMKTATQVLEQASDMAQRLGGPKGHDLCLGSTRSSERNKESIRACLIGNSPGGMGCPAEPHSRSTVSVAVANRTDFQVDRRSWGCASGLRSSREDHAIHTK